MINEGMSHFENPPTSSDNASIATDGGPKLEEKFAIGDDMVDG